MAPFSNNLLLLHYNCHLSNACGNRKWSHVISQFLFQSLFCLYSLPKIFCNQSKKMSFATTYSSVFFLINRVAYILKICMFWSEMHGFCSTNNILKVTVFIFKHLINLKKRSIVCKFMLPNLRSCTQKKIGTGDDKVCNTARKYINYVQWMIYPNQKETPNRVKM